MMAERKRKLGFFIEVEEDQAPNLMPILRILEQYAVASELPENITAAVKAMMNLPTAPDGESRLGRVMKPASGGKKAVHAVGSGSGTRPLAPGHVRHSWSPGDQPGLDSCIKCGMHRQLLDRGNFQFTPRGGASIYLREEVMPVDAPYLRPPFGGETPTCDEGLLEHPRRPPT